MWQLRQKLWAFDNVVINLEERDARIELVHAFSGVRVEVHLRVPPDWVHGPAELLKPKLQILAGERILELASFLDGS